MDIGKFAVQVVLMAPSLIKAGIDIYEILHAAAEKIETAQAENRDITDAEWDEINAKITQLRAERDQAIADLRGTDLSGK